MDVITENKVIPKLRFKEYSEAYKLKRIDCISSLIKDGTHGSHKEESTSDYFLLSAKNIKNGIVNVTDNERRISKEDYESIYKNYCLKNGDILLTIVGTIGRVAVVDNLQKTAFQRSVAFFRFENQNSNYIYQLFTAPNFQKELNRRKVVSAQPGIYLGDLSKIRLQIPTLPEQQKIASFLSAVDEKLQQLTKKKDLLEEYKKGVMQQIFSQELLFKDEIGNNYLDWEEKKLGELCEFAKSGGTPKSTNKEYYNGNIPFLSISDMTKQGKYLNYATKSITEEGVSNSSSWIVPVNTIIYSMYASVGFVAINKIPIATSQAVINLGLNNNCNTEFIYYNLIEIKRIIHRFIETGTQGNLNAQTVKNLKIELPCLKEQEKIANFLSSLDSKIKLVSIQIENTKAFKKGLLQQMFV